MSRLSRRVLLVLNVLMKCVCACSVSQVSADGALSDSSLPLEVFLSRAPVSGPDVERVSSGTMFALKLWLRSLDDL